jgi:hypothetical protein
MGETGPPKYTVVKDVNKPIIDPKRMKARYRDSTEWKLYARYAVVMRASAMIRKKR